VPFVDSLWVHRGDGNLTDVVPGPRGAGVAALPAPARSVGIPALAFRRPELLLIPNYEVNAVKTATTPLEARWASVNRTFVRIELLFFLLFDFELAQRVRA